MAGKVVPLSGVFPESRPDKVTTYDLLSNTTLGGAYPRINPDTLVGRRGLAVYSTMANDEQVKAVLNFKRDAITARGWTFKFRDDCSLSREDQDLRKRILEEIVKRMRGSFNDSLNMIMTGRAYGFSITEKVYGELQVDGKDWTGINRLLGRDPCTFQFYTDEYGMLDKIEQNVTGKPPLAVKPEQVIHYVHAPEWDHVYGRSDLREAYKFWYVKDVTSKLWPLYLEKLAGGFVHAARDIDGPVFGSEEYTALQRAMENVKSMSSIITPPGVTLTITMPPSTSAFKEAVEFADLAIAKALLVPNLLGISHTGQTGAYSQSQTQLEAFFWTLNADAARLEACLNEQLFRDLGDQNWGDGEYPEFSFKPASWEHVKWVIETWTGMITAKAVVPTEEDETFIRKLLEMPPRDEESTPLINPVEEQHRKEDMAAAQETQTATLAQQNKELQAKTAAPGGSAQFAFDPDKHPHLPAGSSVGGQWAPTASGLPPPPEGATGPGSVVHTVVRTWGSDTAPSGTAVPVTYKIYQMGGRALHIDVAAKGQYAGYIARNSMEEAWLLKTSSGDAINAPMRTDDAITKLVTAFVDNQGKFSRFAWDESKHPRVGAGSATGGEWTSGDGGDSEDSAGGPFIVPSAMPKAAKGFESQYVGYDTELKAHVFEFTDSIDFLDNVGGMPHPSNALNEGNAVILQTGRKTFPSEAKAYKAFYKGYDPNVEGPDGKAGAHVFEFPTRDDFLANVGGSEHPLGGPRAILEGRRIKHSWDESKHPRADKGSETGGQWTSGGEGARTSRLANSIVGKHKGAEEAVAATHRAIKEDTVEAHQAASDAHRAARKHADSMLDASLHGMVGAKHRNRIAELQKGKFAWDESKHPRGDEEGHEGEWTSGEGGDEAARKNKQDRYHAMADGSKAAATKKRMEALGGKDPSDNANRFANLVNLKNRKEIVLSLMALSTYGIPFEHESVQKLMDARDKHDRTTRRLRHAVEDTPPPPKEPTTSQTTLEKQEAALRENLETESAYFIDAAGKVVLGKAGTSEHALQWTSKDISKLQDLATAGDLVFTHSHPHGDTLSGDDILLAATINVKEVRAVTEDATYSMVRVKDEWPEVNALQSAMSEAMDAQDAEAAMSALTAKFKGALKYTTEADPNAAT